jgi:tetratricopeptide (TPR) repeat protein
MEIPRCPRCRSSLSEGTEICPACNLRFSEISLYDPKHFIWLSMIFTFVVPAFLAAVNFGRLGRSDLKRAWLIFAIAGLAGIVLVVRYLDQHFLTELGLSGYDERMLSRLGGYAVNLPIGAYLSRKQRPLFRGAQELGIRKASALKGALAGIGIALAVGVVATVAWEIATPAPTQDVLALMDERRFDDAARVLDGLLSQRPDDSDLAYLRAFCDVGSLMDEQRFDEALGLIDPLLTEYPGNEGLLLCKGACHLSRGEWKEAEKAYLECLPLAGERPEIYVYIGFACDQQGRSHYAREFYARAEKTSPGLVKKILGSD